MKQRLVKTHSEKFKTDPEFCVFAPGRVNVIGEHTDYNGGLVMPMALDKGIYVSISRNQSNSMRINSLDFNEYREFDLVDLRPDKDIIWANCPKGIAFVIMDNGHAISGIDITITGNLSMGAGLSSSAAVEVAVGFALNRLFNLNIPENDLAFMCQRAEHEFTGAKCGIMDQLISLHGKKDHLLMLNCADLTFDHIPFQGQNIGMIITNSNVKHDLSAAGGYNERRKECDEIFRIIRGIQSNVKTISEFTLEQLESSRSAFSGILYKRLRHILSENQRVQLTAENLKTGNFNEVGSLLTRSHCSLKNDYEVSCDELDWLVDMAHSVKGVYGSRMTGGGFGGSVVTLIEKDGLEGYKAALAGYSKEFGIEPEVYEAVPSDGAREI
jgi:galactokinase